MAVHLGGFTLGHITTLHRRGRYPGDKFSLFCIFYFQLLIILLLECNCCSGGKILAITPLPAIGHFNYDNAVIKTFANTGHEVTVITSFPEIAAFENYSRVIGVSVPSLTIVNQIPYNFYRQMTEIEVIKDCTFIMKRVCDQVFKTKEYQVSFAQSFVLEMICTYRTTNFSRPIIFFLHFRTF